MQQYHLLKDYHIEVNSCASYNGIWVDGDEVAYTAHLGGCAAGLIIGVMLRQDVRKRNPLIQLLQRSEANIVR